MSFEPFLEVLRLGRKKYLERTDTLLLLLLLLLGFPSSGADEASVPNKIEKIYLRDYAAAVT